MSGGGKRSSVRHKIFVLATAACDALGCRGAPASATHLLLPLQIGGLVMDSRIPNEIEMKKMAQIKSVPVFLGPGIQMLAVKGLQHRVWVLLLTVVVGYQISSTLGYL